MNFGISASFLSRKALIEVTEAFLWGLGHEHDNTTFRSTQIKG